MTLAEAANSGKPFKRKLDSVWIVVRDGGQFGVFRKHGIAVALCLDEIQADDFEVLEGGSLLTDPASNRQALLDVLAESICDYTDLKIRRDQLGERFLRRLQQIGVEVT